MTTKNTMLQFKNEQMFILTLSDIFHQDQILKIKTNDKEYKFKPYKNGYVWTQHNANLNIKNIKLILNERDNTGLRGTYWTGRIKRYKSVPQKKDDEAVRNFLTSRKLYKFYDNICKDIYTFETRKDKTVSPSEGIANEYVFNNDRVYHHYNIDPDQNYSEFSEHFKEKNIIDTYNNLPILFYVDQIPDLVKYDMKIINKVTIEKFHIYDVLLFNNEVCFQIGKMVLSPSLIAMMGDQAGVAVFGNNSNAFGNFKYWKAYKNYNFDDYKQLHPNKSYNSEQFIKID
ncbi:MAG: hypothetical protein ACRCZ0_07705 [Cetobacterium sp.]